MGKERPPPPFSRGDSPPAQFITHQNAAESRQSPELTRTLSLSLSLSRARERGTGSGSLQLFYRLLLEPPVLP